MDIMPLPLRRNIPVVVLFGPKNCGKEMVLIRLTRYLEKIGYTVAPDYSFFPNDNQHYRELCDNFKSICYDRYIIDIDCILVTVLDRIGREICQLLKLPGDMCYDPSNPSQIHMFIRYLLDAINRPVWIMMCELDQMLQEERTAYVKKIDALVRLMRPHSNVTKSKTLRSLIHNIVAKFKMLRSLMSHRSNFIITSTKIDLHHRYLDYKGEPIMGEIYHAMSAQYPDIFKIFANRNPFTRFFMRYNCYFNAFSAGTFVIDEVENVIYVAQSADVYPMRLWEQISKAIRR